MPLLICQYAFPVHISIGSALKYLKSGAGTIWEVWYEGKK